MLGWPVETFTVLRLMNKSSRPTKSFHDFPPARSWKQRKLVEAFLLEVLTTFPLSHVLHFSFRAFSLSVSVNWHEFLSRRNPWLTARSGEEKASSDTLNWSKLPNVRLFLLVDMTSSAPAQFPLALLQRKVLKSSFYAGNKEQKHLSSSESVNKDA